MRLAAKFSLDPLIQRHKPSPLSENYRRKGYPPALEKNAQTAEGVSTAAVSQL